MRGRVYFMLGHTTISMVLVHTTISSMVNTCPYIQLHESAQLVLMWHISVCYESRMQGHSLFLGLQGLLS